MSEPARPRRKLIFGALSLLFLLCLFAAWAWSTVWIPPRDMWTAIFSDEASWQRAILLEVRLPRVLVATLSGAALAVSGTLLQGLFRNPLAEPTLMGVSSGSALGAVLCMFSGLATRFVWAIPAGSFAGAFLSTLVVYFVASRRNTSNTGLLLVGIAVSQLAAALTSLIISFAVANYAIGSQIVRWLLGGFEGRSWLHVFWGLGPVLVGLVLAMRDARQLDALLLGETGAASVGVDVRQVRRNLIFSASLLTGASVAIGGSIAFVGLVVPHTLRRVLGSNHRALLPAAALGGATFLVLCDLLARTLIAPGELPIGVVTSALGAPLFFKLAFERKIAES